MTDAETPITLDIIIPVYNEGENIRGVLESFAKAVHSPYRVLICYDKDDDDTLPAVREHQKTHDEPIEFVKSRGRGPHDAVMAGVAYSSAPCVLTYPADDTFNADTIDDMVRNILNGCEIVSASRFIEGGCMEGAPPLKAVLVRTAAFTLYHIARLPAHDATNGLRMFSRRVVKTIPSESTAGFCYSLEWLVKVHRLGWKVGEVPSRWFERKAGTSRFRIMKWVPKYMRWYAYAFATTFLRAKHVVLREPTAEFSTPAANRS